MNQRGGAKKENDPPSNIYIHVYNFVLLLGHVAQRNWYMFCIYKVLGSIIGILVERISRSKQTFRDMCISHF